MAVKKSLFIFFMLLLAFSAPVSAHTGLKNSSPTDGETVTERMQEIRLEFETAIENGSTLSLIDESGAEISIENVELSESEMTATTTKPLGGGQYSVSWRIVGEDGHVIEGTYSFIIQLENEVNEGLGTVNEQNERNDQAAEAEDSPGESNPAPAVNDAEKQSESKSNIIIPLITGFMLFIALQTAMWLIKRSKK